MADSCCASRPAGGGNFGTGHFEVFGTASLAVNTWSHIAVTYDGANLRLYVNGTQVSSVARTGTIPTSTNPLQLGGDSIYGQYFAGAMDEVRIYNRALSAAEVVSDMNTAIGSSDVAPPAVVITSHTNNQTV